MRYVPWRWRDGRGTCYRRRVSGDSPPPPPLFLKPTLNDCSGGGSNRAVTGLRRTGATFPATVTRAATTWWRAPAILAPAIPSA